MKGARQGDEGERLNREMKTRKSDIRDIRWRLATGVILIVPIIWLIFISLWERT